MDRTNPSAKGSDNVRKVYISDSPVADDTVEYAYVSSDIEDDIDINSNSRIKTPHPNGNMTSQPDLSEVDELAKEADYQRELQDRLQTVTLSGPPQSSVENSPAASPADLKQPENGSTDYSSDLLEWENPPANPFLNQSLPNNAYHDESTPRFNSNLNNSTGNIGQESPNKMQQKQVIDNRYQNSSTSSPHFARPPNIETHHPQPVSSPQYQTQNGLQQSPAGYQQVQQQQPPQQQSSQPSQQYQQQQEQAALQYQQYNYQVSNGNEQDPYVQQQQAELERAQYQQLQQQQLQQQQLFIQQQMFQQQLQQQQQQQQQQQLQQQQQQNELQQVPQGLMVQRNMPVMYIQNNDNQNEYYAVTPRDAYHSYAEQYAQFAEPGNNGDFVNGQEDNWRSMKAIVAPKPVRPTKNYLEKNKVRAAGQLSAKPGYSQRLVQKRVEQEQMKEWAPGMIVPRKKAASADDIIRGGERGELQSAEDVWSKRSRDLANAKQTKLAGGKGKKQNNKASNLRRFPSDNSLSKRSRIPPIAPTEPRGYLVNYHAAQHGWSAEELRQSRDPLPGQANGHLSPNGQSPMGVYNKGGPPGGPKSNIPHHPPIQQYPVYGSPLFAPQPSPIYGEGSYSPMYQQGYDVHYQQGPPSGGYHHQPRQEVMRQPDYQRPPHPPIDNNGLQKQGNYAPLKHQSSYNSQDQYSQQHPTYDYSGYLNSSGAAVELANERDMKAFDGSPYSSPHPPYSGNTYATDTSSTKKMPLNPYAAVPPIHNLSKLMDNKGLSGSYVVAYQKEKEKAENHAKGPTYKQYTMKDYKKLKLEIKLGGLGPSQDPEAVKEKNEARLKQLQYAKEAMEQEKKKPHVSPRKLNRDDEIQHISGRQLAVEYAKHIPKPKITSNHKPADQNKQLSPTYDSGVIPALKPVEHTDQPSRQTPSTMEPVNRQIDLVELEDLQRRHEEERRAVAEIQYKMQQTA